MGVHLTPVQIHSMGIEKLIPRRSDLAVFTRLLARSATGQPVTVFTSHHRNPKPAGEMHIILVDNGRTEQLGKPDFRSSLKCIRCGACMNTCPIYRRSGGHSYETTIPGPIGSILTPGIDLKISAVCVKFDGFFNILDNTLDIYSKVLSSFLHNIILKC